MSNRLVYRPDIDGLRAVAILPVVFFHAGILFPGGYVGVDIFFVISGYLITSLIQKDFKSGQFNLLDFWERRARRIIPAMSVVIVSTLVAGWFLLLPYDFKEIAQSAIAQSAMLSNFYFWREGGYFAGPADLKPLLHMWSLAVEEQFYLIIAPVALILFRGLDRFTSLAVALLMLGSFLWSIDRVSSAPDAAFYLLPSRAWELLLGTFMAIHGDRAVLKRCYAEIVSWLGAIAIVYALFAYDHTTAFPGTAALLPCFGAAALIWSHSMGSTFLGKVLSLLPMVFIGRISYSLYLWHWPILAYANYFDVIHSSTTLPFLLVALSILAGGFSWLWIETPFRSRKVCETRKSILFVSTCALLLIFLSGILIHSKQGFRHRFSEQTLRYADARIDKNPRRNETMDLPGTSFSQNGFPRIGNILDPRDPILLVIGDSHCDALLPVIERLCIDYRLPAIVANRHATFPLPTVYGIGDNIEKHRFQQQVIESINSTTNLQHVLLVGRWIAYKNAFLDKGIFLNFHNKLQKRGVQLWLFRQVPEPIRNVPRTLALNTHFARLNKHPGVDYSQSLQNRKKTHELFEQLETHGAHVMDPFEWFFPDKTRSLVKSNGYALFFDDNHLSAFGAMQLRPIIEPMFSQISKSEGMP